MKKIQVRVTHEPFNEQQMWRDKSVNNNTGDKSVNNNTGDQKEEDMWSQKK